MLFLECSEEVLLDRLLGRSKNSQRVDDNAASIHKRFETFRVQTLPVREWARERGKLVQVDASGTVEQVYQQCAKYFSTK